MFPSVLIETSERDYETPMTFLIGRVSSPVRILRSFAFMIVLVSTILLVFNIPDVRASQISWSNVYSPGGNAGGALIVSSVNDGGVIGADAGTSYGETMYQVFFFQAEDGIRDLTVTGVQTCALPISAVSRSRISPTMMMLGSWRISARTPSAKPS